MAIQRKIQTYLRRLQKKSLPKPSVCPNCRASGGLRWHGHYVRQLIAIATTYSLLIQRISCDNCGQTTGLLPDFVLKFHRYAKEVITLALRKLKTHTYESVAELLISLTQRDNLATLTLYFWRKKLAGTS